MPPLMIVEWEAGDGRVTTSVGFCIHEDESISGMILLAGGLDPANGAENIAHNVQEIPVCNVIGKRVQTQPKRMK